MNCVSTLMLAKTISVVSGSIVGVDCNSPIKTRLFGQPHPFYIDNNYFLVGSG